MKKYVLFTVLVIILIIYIFVGIRIYYSYKILVQKGLGISYALQNALKCPEVNCKFNDENLPVPDINAANFPENIDISKTSKFIANTIGKISQPGENIDNLPVMGKYNYLGKLFGVSILDTKNKIIYIIFRGTRTWSEWKQDFNFAQIFNDFTIQEPIPKMTAKQEVLPLDRKQLNVFNRNLLMAADPNKIQYVTPPMIHKGFLNIYNSFKNAIFSDIDKYPDFNIIIGGHSLGSAISSILALELSTKNKNILVNVFASPRIGDITFATGFSSIPNIKYYHWCNLCDIIPTVPLAVMPNLESPKSPYFYMPIPSSETCTVISFEKNWFSLENNHTLPLYIEYLKGK